MTYQELQDILKIRQASPMGYTPSLDDIISGIQSQYQSEQQQFAPQAQSFQQPAIGSFGQGAQRFVPQGSFASQETPFIEYGRQVQPSFTRGAFNIADYKTPSTSELIDTIGGSGNTFIGGSDGGDGGSTGGTSIGDSGLASSTNVSPTGVGIGALGLGLVSGLPVGLLSSIIGKQNIANTINAQAHAQNAAFNQALVAAQMGIANTPANAAAIAAAIDSLSAANPTAPSAISAAQAAQGVTGVSGGSAASAAAAAAAAASAAGHSDAAIGAASQAAATASVNGASPAAAASIGQDAAASVDGGTTGSGSATGVGVGSTTGVNGMDAASDSASAASSAAAGVAAADGVGADGPGTGTGVGVGGDGGKIICTKLYELGLMPKNIYDADQAFGKKLVNDSPETYYGYVRWAKNIVDLMSRNDLLGKTAIFCAYHIATPWSLAMAEEMGQPVKPSWFGKFLMKRGLQFCKLIGSGNKQTALA